MWVDVVEVVECGVLVVLGWVEEGEERNDRQAKSHQIRRLR
jgi:hypothetical protein